MVHLKIPSTVVDNMIKALVLLCLAATALAQDLSAIADRSGVKFWRDRGGTGRKDVTIYEPVRSGSDWYILGQRAQGDYEKLQREVHSFRDDTPRKDSLSRPGGFRFIWDDRGSTYYDDASVWRAICSRGYEALGDVLTRKNRRDSPPSEIFDKFRCVADDIVATCDIGNKIWDNAGTWGKYYISMWEAKPRRDHFNTGFYYAKNQHNERPDVRPRCLKRNAVRVL